VLIITPLEVQRLVRMETHITKSGTRHLVQTVLPTTELGILHSDLMERHITILRILHLVQMDLLTGQLAILLLGRADRHAHTLELRFSATNRELVWLRLLVCPSSEFNNMRFEKCCYTFYVSHPLLYPTLRL